MLDPVKKDYVVVDGSPVPSDRIFEVAYFASLIPQGQWMYGVSGQGSLLYTLEGTKRTGAIEQTYAAYMQDALQRQLIDTNLAESVDTVNLQATPTGTLNQTTIVPKQTQLSNQISFVPV